MEAVEAIFAAPRSARISDHDLIRAFVTHAETCGVHQNRGGLHNP